LQTDTTQRLLKKQKNGQKFAYNTNYKKLLVRPCASKRRPVPYRSPLVSNMQW